MSRSAWAVFVAVLLAHPAYVDGQTPDSGHPVEVDEIRARQALLALKEAQAEFERARQLKEEGLIAAAEFQRKEVAFERASLEYEAATLSLEGFHWRVRLTRAQKGQRAGSKVVRISIVAERGPARTPGREAADERFQPIRVYLSLRDGAVVVARPYEQALDIPAPNREVSADFTLLRDVEEATVSWRRGGRVEETRVILEKEGSGNSVSIESERFSQECDLGSDAVYDLKLEGFSASARSYRLGVVGLPPEIRSEFVDSTTQARLSHVRFAAGSKLLPLDLRLRLPRESTATVQVDRPIDFFVVAFDEEGNPGRSVESFSKADLLELRRQGALRGGMLQLEILPRGLAELTVSIAELFVEVHPGETRSIPILLRNAGTRQLEALRLSAEIPARWRWVAEPPEVPALPAGREARVAVSLTVDRDTLPGEREIKLRFERGIAAGKSEIEEKVIRVRVIQASSLWAVVALGTLLACVVAAVFWVTIRLGLGRR